MKKHQINYIKNRDYYLQYGKDHREEISEKKKEYHQKNKESIAIKKKLYYEKKKLEKPMKPKTVILVDKETGKEI